MSEKYDGVKFETEMTGTEIPNNPRLFQLQHWCKIFHENNLAPPYTGGSFGNLSLRIGERKDPFIITASNSSLADSETEGAFVTVSSVNLEKGIVYAQGIKKPSSEAMLHYAIYQQRPEVNAVFHGHCGPISDHIDDLKIPITKREQECGTIELVNEVMDVLGDYFFIEMRNHGFISLGRSMQDAGDLVMKILEKTGQLK